MLSALFIAISVLTYAQGMKDDYHVEQVHSPYVSLQDLGTHMTRSGQPDYTHPFTSTSRQEYHNEQRFVNNQPVYEKRLERRYEDGRLIHEDGHTRGDPEYGSNVHMIGSSGAGGYAGALSGGGSSYSSSSSSSSRSYGVVDRDNKNSLYNSDGERTSYIAPTETRVGTTFHTANTVGNDYQDKFRKDVERLRQQLHAGTSVIRTPATGTNTHEEKTEESHFVDGHKVYHRNEERRYEDGRLIHDVDQEQGQRLDAETASLAHNRQMYPHSSIGSNYSPSTDTTYRASYWRPGPQTRRVSSNVQRQHSSSSSVYRPKANRIRYVNANTLSGIPSSSTSIQKTSASTLSSTNLVPTESGKPAFRPSYTPRVVERVPQSSRSNLQFTARQHYSSSNNQQEIHPSSTHTSLSNKPDVHPTYRNYESHPHSTSRHVPESHWTRYENSTSSRRQFSIPYTSGSYAGSGEPYGSSQINYRVPDSYSEPYSERSSTQQPTFANYSTWSHWRSSSTAPSQTTISTSSLEDVKDRNNYNQENHDSSLKNTEDSHSESESSSYSTQTNQAVESENLNIFPPGYLYEEHETYNNIDSTVPNYQSTSYGAETEQYSHRQSTDYNFEQRFDGQDDNIHHPVDASVKEGTSSPADFSITVDVGEGDVLHLSEIDTNNIVSEANKDDERYDISPIVDGGLGEHDHEAESNTEGRVLTNDLHYSSHNTNINSNNIYAPVGSTLYDRTTRVTNQTTNTYTSQIQPLISSYKVEIRTSRRYLNGKLMSETRYNRYFENGMLVHENQTERSRDEMITDGIDVDTLDLSTDDMKKYGMVNVESVPTAHSQRFEMNQEKEYLDGNQIYQSTHERHFQDGQLVYEDHNELGENDLASLGTNNREYTNSLDNRREDSYASHFVGNRNYGSSLGMGTYEGPKRTGSRQKSGVDEKVTVIVSPITKTRKTEIRQEQEFRDGQKTYDLRHERRFDDGNLVHESYSEKGPDEFEVDGQHDALHDLISGRVLATKTQSGYIPSPAARAQYNREYSSISQPAPDYHRQSESQSLAYLSQQGFSQQPNTNSDNLVGNSLLTTGCLTCVIGSSGTTQFSSIGDRVSDSGGEHASRNISESYSSSSSYGADTTPGAGYYLTATNTGRDSASRSDFAANRGHLSTGYNAVGNFGAYSENAGGGDAVTHRREMEVEEHYENDRLVSGREEDKEWKNKQLVRHDQRNYGEEGGRRGSAYSEQSSPGLTSSSNYLTYGGTDAYGTHAFAASATFDAQREGTYGSHPFYGSSGVTHTREKEVEEHYEDGRLVSGREEDRQWTDDRLLRHDRRHYGEGRSTSSVFSNSLAGECSDRPCRNGGSCIVGTRGYICVCTFGYKGPECEEAYCPTRYCRQEGICQITPEGSHSCSCPHNYTGPRCEHRTRDRGVH